MSELATDHMRTFTATTTILFRKPTIVYDVADSTDLHHLSPPGGPMGRSSCVRNGLYNLNERGLGDLPSRVADADSNGA